MFDETLGALTAPVVTARSDKAKHPCDRDATRAENAMICSIMIVDREMMFLLIVVMKKSCYRSISKNQQPQHYTKTKDDIHCCYETMVMLND